MIQPSQYDSPFPSTDIAASGVAVYSALMFILLAEYYHTLYSEWRNNHKVGMRRSRAIYFFFSTLYFIITIPCFSLAYTMKEQTCLFFFFIKNSESAFCFLFTTAFTVYYLDYTDYKTYNTGIKKKRGYIIPLVINSYNILCSLLILILSSVYVATSEMCNPSDPGRSALFIVIPALLIAQEFSLFLFTIGIGVWVFVSNKDLKFDWKKERMFSVFLIRFGVSFFLYFVALVIKMVTTIVYAYNSTSLTRYYVFKFMVADFFAMLSFVGLTFSINRNRGLYEHMD